MFSNHGWDQKHNFKLNSIALNEQSFTRTCVDVVEYDV